MKIKLLMFLLYFSINLAEAADNGGDVSFLGVVTDTTCDIQVQVNGAASNIITFNSTRINRFVNGPDLVIKPATTCTNLTRRTVVISWAGDIPSTDNTYRYLASVMNTGGSATKAYVTVSAHNPVNAQPNVVRQINAYNVSFRFKGTTFIKEGAIYKTKFISQATTGTFRGALAFVVSYE